MATQAPTSGGHGARPVIPPSSPSQTSRPVLVFPASVHPAPILGNGRRPATTRPSLAMRSPGMQPCLPPSLPPPRPPLTSQIASDRLRSPIPLHVAGKKHAHRAPKSRPAPSRVMHESKKHIKPHQHSPRPQSIPNHSSTHSVDAHVQPPIPGIMPARPLTGLTTCIRPGPICRIFIRK